MYKFLFLLLFLTSYAAAQTGQIEIGRRTYRSQIIAGTPGTYEFAGAWRFFRTTPEEKWQRIGLSGKRLKILFSTNAGAMEDFEQYRWYKISSDWCAAGSSVCVFGATMSGLGWLMSGVLSDPSTGRDHRLGQLALAGFVGGIGIGIGGRFLRRKSDRYLQRAVEQYNRQQTSAAPVPQESFRLCIRPSGNYGIGIAMGF